MPDLKYDPDNTLAGGLFGMTPKEAVRLGIQLCAAVEQAVGADGCHGGVWPGNLTWADGKVALGPENRQGIAEMSPEALEFVSPEQFWSGTCTPASDVYSIGLILYTALNRGVMPYFKKAEDNSPEERAEALQSRMKGERLAYPSAAARALGDVVLKAAAYQAENRYATPGRLRAALEVLPEGSTVPAAVPPVVLSKQERERAPSYKVDKDFETPEAPRPQKARSRSTRKSAAMRKLISDDTSNTEQVLRALVAGRAAQEPEPAQEPKTLPEPKQEPPPEPKPEPAPERKPEPESVPVVSPAVAPSVSEPPREEPKRVEPPRQEVHTEQPPAPEPKQKEKQTQQKPKPEPKQEKKPEPEPQKPKKRLPGEVDENMDAKEFRAPQKKRNLAFPIILAAVIVVAVIFVFRSCHDGTTLPEGPAPTAPTSAVEATPTAPAETAPSATTAVPVETEPQETQPPVGPRYGLLMGDFSWTEAKEQAEKSGGHLATLRNGIDLHDAIELAEQNGARFVWLGASRSSEDGSWYYVTGEPVDFADWDVGQPRNTGGEDYMLLRYRLTQGTWAYAGSIDDPVSALPGVYGGKIAYLVEYPA